MKLLNYTREALRVTKESCVRCLPNAGPLPRNTCLLAHKAVFARLTLLNRNLGKTTRLHPVKGHGTRAHLLRYLSVLNILEVTLGYRVIPPGLAL